MSDEDELRLCPSCGKAVASDAHFCEHCNAPLTPHAATDPMGQIYSEGHIWRQAVKRASKPIVVTGMWLLWGPVALVAGIILVIFVWGLFQVILGIDQGGNPDWFEVTFVWLTLFVVFGGMLCIAGVLLFRTTRRFIESRKSGNQQQRAEEGESLESRK